MFISVNKKVTPCPSYTDFKDSTILPSHFKNITLSIVIGQPIKHLMHLLCFEIVVLPWATALNDAHSFSEVKLFKRTL
jgi:hypothetical protein